jgi:signal transduction histidine kinase
VASVEAPLTVLLVEDNPNDARLIRRHLENAETAFLPDEITLYHERRLDDGLRRLDETAVDLLLLDLGLPESDGADTFERARGRTAGVPVVVLTNLQDEQTAVDLLKQGAQDYLNKGALSEEQLVKSVRYALERQEQKRKLQATTEQLEVLNRILRHDIQNDVQVLQMWSKGLLDSLPAEHEADLRKIIETSEHIQELTENSRAYIEAVTGETDLETEPTRLDDVLRDELQKARSVADSATFTVEGSIPPATVTANGMLSSVFRNLLNNAVQHSTSDAPEVEICVTERESVVRVTIADDGPGVPDAQKTRIFGKGEHGLESAGTGIGLYLVNTLVTKFGGEVWVDDREDGSGAVFVVELLAADGWSGA